MQPLIIPAWGMVAYENLTQDVKNQIYSLSALK